MRAAQSRHPLLLPKNVCPAAASSEPMKAYKMLRPLRGHHSCSLHCTSAKDLLRIDHDAAPKALLAGRLAK